MKSRKVTETAEEKAIREAQEKLRKAVGEILNRPYRKVK